MGDVIPFKEKRKAEIKDELQRADEVQLELQKGMVKDEEGNVVLDEIGNPVFKDKIRWMTDGPQIRALWECCKVFLENTDPRYIPEELKESILHTMDMLAKAHRKTNKQYRYEMPVNYFTGLWQVVRYVKDQEFFMPDERLHNKIKELAIWLAEQLDIYHEIKRKEQVHDEASPEDISRLLPRNNSKKLYYSSDDPNKAEDLRLLNHNGEEPPRSDENSNQ
jgi:hypothetical protein